MQVQASSTRNFQAQPTNQTAQVWSLVQDAGTRPWLIDRDGQMVDLFNIVVRG